MVDLLWFSSFFTPDLHFTFCLWSTLISSRSSIYTPSTFLLFILLRPVLSYQYLLILFGLTFRIRCLQRLYVHLRNILQPKSHLLCSLYIPLNTKVTCSVFKNNRFSSVLLLFRVALLIQFSDKDLTLFKTACFNVLKLDLW